MNELVQSVIDFHRKAEKLKATTRHSWLSDPGRQESVADHSWMVCLLAIVLADKVDLKIDLFRTLKMLVIHDLVEAITGDIVASDAAARNLDKYDSERKAMEDLVVGLDKETQVEILDLWEEFESKETVEAKFGQALDKIEAILQHNVSDVSTWDQGDFDVHPYYKDGFFDFDSFMRVFKDTVDNQSMEKIILAGAENRIGPEHLARYRQNVPE